MEMPEDKVRKVLKIAKEPISPGNADRRRGRFHLGDFIEDKNAAPIDAAIREPARNHDPRAGQPHAARGARCCACASASAMNTDHTLEEVGQQFASPASASARSRPRPAQAQAPEPAPPSGGAFFRLLTLDCDFDHGLLRMTRTIECCVLFADLRGSTGCTSPWVMRSPPNG
jgi:hypothetical protein